MEHSAQESAVQTCKSMQFNAHGFCNVLYDFIISLLLLKSTFTSWPGMLWHSSRHRWVLGIEKLALQGIFAEVKGQSQLIFTQSS